MLEILYCEADKFSDAVHQGEQRASQPGSVEYKSKVFPAVLTVCARVLQQPASNSKLVIHKSDEKPSARGADAAVLEQEHAGSLRRLPFTAGRGCNAQSFDVKREMDRSRGEGGNHSRRFRKQKRNDHGGSEVILQIYSLNNQNAAILHIHNNVSGLLLHLEHRFSHVNTASII